MVDSQVNDKQINSLLFCRQMEIWQTNLSHIFVDVQIKDKFYCQESIIMHGVSAYESVNKRKNKFSLK